MSYDMGKKLTLLGFGGALLLYVVNTVAGLIFPAGLGMISSILSTICAFAAAGGFGIMFLDRRNILDLVIAGGIGLNVIYSFMVARVPIMNIVMLIVMILASLYPLAWAFKFKDKNMMVAMLLAAAFLYPIAFSIFTMVVIGTSQAAGAPLWLGIINVLGTLVCHAIKLFAAYSEE